MPCESQDVTNKQRLIEILKKMLIYKLIRPNEKKHTNFSDSDNYRTYKVRL